MESNAAVTLHFEDFAVGVGPVDKTVFRCFSPFKIETHIPLKKSVFWINMESNAAVTLHFEDFAVQNYLFLKDVCICW